MNDEHRRRRVVAAQGFAAAAFFVFAHGARAETTPAHVHAKPPAPGHAPALCQTKRT
jgi:hypothetical protein